MHYSASTGGFYLEAMHGDSMPSDVTKIEVNFYNELMYAQSVGQRIVPGENGQPKAAGQENRLVKVISCTPAQGLVALFALKQITEDHVFDAIAKIPDQVQQYTVRIGYQRATTWERGSPTMLFMAQLLHLSDDDLEALFSYAVTVQV